LICYKRIRLEMGTHLYINKCICFGYTPVYLCVGVQLRLFAGDPFAAPVIRGIHSHDNLPCVHAVGFRLPPVALAPKDVHMHKYLSLPLSLSPSLSLSLCLSLSLSLAPFLSETETAKAKEKPASQQANQPASQPASQPACKGFLTTLCSRVRGQFMGRFFSQHVCLGLLFCVPACMCVCLLLGPAPPD